MTELGRPSDEHIEAMVRSHLAHEAERVSAPEMLARVGRARGVAPPVRRKRWLRPFVATAALLLAFAGGMLLSPTPVRATSAEVLVREARKVHAVPRDRCYLVQITPEPGGPLERYPRLRQGLEHRLWTRGDRFYLESINAERHRWVWGRDEQNRIWTVLNRKDGYRFETGEVREDISYLCDLMSMKADALLDDLLKHFDLTREASGESSDVIRAVPRNARVRARLMSAVLEIDAESKALRRLELRRAVAGTPTATLTYTLIETGDKPDSAYTIEGHLASGASIHRGMPEDARKVRLIRTLFGMPPR